MPKWILGEVCCKSLGAWALWCAEGSAIMRTFILKLGIECKRENTQVRIAILFSGSGSNLENIVAQQKDIAAALSPYHITPHIVLAMSNNPSAYGIAHCKRLGLECKVIDHRDFGSRALFDQALARCLESHHIDLVVLAGFMRILGQGL